MKKFIFLIALLIAINCQSAVYKKVVVDDKDALCLDGTKGVYYISQGKNLTKFILYFEGGAWCGANDLASTLQSCYQRSKGDLGSSKNYPDTISSGQGILSNNVKNSFNDFTKVYIKYCDGSGHQGTKSTPVQYKDAKLYFRGSNLTISKLQHLQKTHGLLTKSTQIMVSGASAGGLAAFTWADYIRNRTTHKNVYAAPDSGIFLDSANVKSKQNQYKNGFANLFKLSNVQIPPPLPQCVKAYPNQPFKCQLVQYMHTHIKTPLFAIQSLYDTWAVSQILGIKCIKNRSLQGCTTQQRNTIEQYHRNTTKVVVSIGQRADNGVWAPVCADHVYSSWDAYYSPSYNIPMASNRTVDSTLHQWVNKKTGYHRHIDQGIWPDNKPCSGLSNNLSLQSVIA